MNGYSTFPKAAALLEPHHYCLVLYPGHSLEGRGLTHLQRCSSCSLQPQPTEQYTELNGKTVLFQIIQFCINMQFKCKNSPLSTNTFYFHFKQFSLAWVCNLNVKIVLFQAIQFSISMQFSSIWPYQMLPLQARVDLGVIAMKEYSTFLKAPALQLLLLLSVISRIVVEGESYSSAEMQSCTLQPQLIEQPIAIEQTFKML